MRRYSTLSRHRIPKAAILSGNQESQDDVAQSISRKPLERGPSGSGPGRIGVCVLRAYSCTVFSPSPQKKQERKQKMMLNELISEVGCYWRMCEVPF